MGIETLCIRKQFICHQWLGMLKDKAFLKPRVETGDEVLTEGICGRPQKAQLPPPALGSGGVTDSKFLPGTVGQRSNWNKAWSTCRDSRVHTPWLWSGRCWLRDARMSLCALTWMELTPCVEGTWGPFGEDGVELPWGFGRVSLHSAYHCSQLKRIFHCWDSRNQKIKLHTQQETGLLCSTILTTAVCPQAIRWGVAITFHWWWDKGRIAERFSHSALSLYTDQHH